MPRDSAGLYTLPNNAVADGTVIQAAWANSSFGDFAVQFNNVLTKDGLVGPSQPFLLTNGGLVAPALAFASQPNLGLFRDALNVLAIGSNAIAVAKFSNLAIDLLKPVNVTGDLTLTGKLVQTGAASFTNLVVGSGINAANPSIAFAVGTEAEADMGWYVPTANSIAMAANGGIVGVTDFSIDKNTSQNFYPRVSNATGTCGLSLFSQPNGHADKSGVTLSMDHTLGAYLSSIGPNGTTNRKKFTLQANDFKFSCSAADVTIDGNGSFVAPYVGIDGTVKWYQDATNVVTIFAANYYWTYTKATGNLNWSNPNGSFTFYQTGDFFVPRNISCAGTIASNGSITAGANGMSTTGTITAGTINVTETLTAKNVTAAGAGGGAMNCVNLAASGAISATGNFASGGAFGFTGGNLSYFHKGGIVISSGGFGIAGDGGTYANVIDCAPLALPMYMVFAHKSGTYAHISMQVGTPAPAFYRFSNDAGGAGNASKSGADPYWGMISDREKKHDIKDYIPGLSQILAVQPKSFKLNDFPKEQCMGIIADEIVKIFPQSVKQYAGASVFTPNAIFWAMVNSIKQLASVIEELNVRITNLEGAI